MIWQTARSPLDLTRRGVVMGILNLTPDSFSDGGVYAGLDAAVAHALAMLAAGAAIIDLGGESTRPGAVPVPAEEEAARVLPVVTALLERAPECLISIDTSKAAVAAAALDRGAAIVNDVTALSGDPAMAEIVARTGAGVILMHMQGTPATMQHAPAYQDVVSEVGEFLQARFETALAAGISPECIALDPGIGFGKTAAHTLTLLRELARLEIGGRPLALGVSRKAFLAEWAGTKALPDRLGPTVAITAWARERGVRIHRVHDVQPNVAALRIVEALL